MNESSFFWNIQKINSEINYFMKYIKKGKKDEIIIENSN